MPLILFKTNETKINKDYIIIPDEAIRLRVIANSNSIEDQYIKKEVKKEIEQILNQKLVSLNTIEESRTMIKENIEYLKNYLENYLKEKNYEKTLNINYGKNYFPKKEYKGISYKEGYYESLVITLGNGKGDNWWCVLFPPLCLLDAKEKEEVEYKFFVKELIDKIFKN